MAKTDVLGELMGWGDERKGTRRIRFPRAVEKAIWDKYKHKCAICGRTISFADGEIDHIKPLRKGGSNRPSNLQWLCHRCNKLKSHKRTNAGVRKLLGLTKQQATKKKPKKKTTARKKKTTRKTKRRRRKPKSIWEL